MRAHISTRSLTDFSRIQLNLIKALEFICRVFHRDIPTITRLVPLQYPPPLAEGLNNLILVKTYYLSRFYIFSLVAAAV